MASHGAVDSLWQVSVTRPRVRARDRLDRATRVSGGIAGDFPARTAFATPAGYRRLSPPPAKRTRQSATTRFFVAKHGYGSGPAAPGRQAAERDRPPGDDRGARVQCQTTLRSRTSRVYPHKRPSSHKLGSLEEGPANLASNRLVGSTGRGPSRWRAGVSSQSVYSPSQRQGCARSALSQSAVTRFSKRAAAVDV
jgi:hypothetical protein